MVWGAKAAERVGITRVAVHRSLQGCKPADWAEKEERRKQVTENEGPQGTAAGLRYPTPGTSWTPPKSAG